MEEAKERAMEKAEEPVTISKGKLWYLYVAAAGGAFSILSHGLELLAKL